MPKDLSMLMTLLLVQVAKKSVQKTETPAVWLEPAKTMKYSVMIDIVRIVIYCLKGPSGRFT